MQYQFLPIGVTQSAFKTGVSNIPVELIQGFFFSGLFCWIKAQNYEKVSSKYITTFKTIEVNYANHLEISGVGADE